MVTWNRCLRGRNWLPHSRGKRVKIRFNGGGQPAKAYPKELFEGLRRSINLVLAEDCGLPSGFAARKWRFDVDLFCAHRTI